MNALSTIFLGIDLSGRAPQRQRASSGSGMNAGSGVTVGYHGSVSVTTRQKGGGPTGLYETLRSLSLV